MATRFEQKRSSSRQRNYKNVNILSVHKTCVGWIEMSVLYIGQNMLPQK